jgi:hypothetical protein
MQEFPDPQAGFVPLAKLVFEPYGQGHETQTYKDGGVFWNLVKCDTWWSAVDTRALKLKSGEAVTASATALPMPLSPPMPPTVQCDCCAGICHTDHGMQCPSFAAQTTMRHDSLKGMFCPVACRAGIASTLQRALRSLPVLAEGTGISAMGTGIWVAARVDHSSGPAWGYHRC